MLNTPSPNRAAETRINNDKLRAKQGTVVGNNAGKQVFQPPARPAAPARPAGKSQMQPQSVTGQAQGQPLVPKGFRPVYPKTAERPSINNEINALQMNPEVQGLMDEIHLDNLINSSETQNALTKVRLRDFFNDRDSNVGGEVLDILQSMKNSRG